MSAGTGFTDHFWESPDDLTLHACEYGTNRHKLPVICIPGLTRNARDFEDSAPWIAAQGRRVFAVSLRGRGQSQWDPKHRYNPRTYADDMAALLTFIGAAKALFVGTSLGGLVTMVLAARKPRLVGGAVLNDVGPRVAKAGLKRIQGYAGKTVTVQTWADAAAYVRQINSVAFPHYTDEVWMAVAHRLFRDEGGRPVLDHDPNIFSTPAAWKVRLAEPLVWAAFKKLSQSGPLLLVHGEASDVIDSATIARMQRLAPDMAIAPVAGVGHAPELTEQAARVELAHFLDSAP